MDVLADRANPLARPLVIDAAKSADAGVRGAALKALANLGDASAVPVLLAATGDDREIARASLAALRGPGINDALVAQLRDANAETQSEIVRCLAARRARSAVPMLLELARTGNEPAVTALGELAGREAVPSLLKLLADAKTDAERSAWVNVVGRIGGSDAWPALRAVVKDGSPAVRDVAIRALAERGGPEVAPDLLKVATESADETQRVLALRGYWRVVGLAVDRPLDERWKLCEAGMAASRRIEEKRLGIAELAKLPHPNAIKLLRALTEDTTVNAEARQALAGLEEFAGYITTWQVAGPYRQAGKQCQELFDIAFAPEQPGAPGVEWKPVPAAWQVDLLPLAGGHQCVMYLKTRVSSPREQPVRLEIGSDDGNKVWINGKLVHANNALRPIQPGQDKAEAVLKEGWNDVLVKVTQNIMGFAVCVRVRNPDGSAADCSW